MSQSVLTTIASGAAEQGPENRKAVGLRRGASLGPREQAMCCVCGHVFPLGEKPVRFVFVWQSPHEGNCEVLRRLCQEQEGGGL